MVKNRDIQTNHTKKHTHTHSQKEKKEKKSIFKRKKGGSEQPNQ